MTETAILVLLYNNQPNESKTLNSLLSSVVHYLNAKLVIWNNGPKSFKKTEVALYRNLGYEVFFEETLHNESLAVIYNRFLSCYDAKRYIFLDDDSNLTAPYILASCKSEVTCISLPIISFKNQVVYPKIQKKPYYFGINITGKSKVISIGSGLVIGRDFAVFMKKNYGNVFDERFYFYGVDTTFFLRIFYSKLTSRINIIPGFIHSLSRLEKESKELKKFRRIERSYEQALILRYYRKKPVATFLLIKHLLSVIKRFFFKQENRISIFSLYKAFFTGKHYRIK
ncbi:hypothetical protein OW492_08960 [Psychromonas sp. 14N.309.X.WAT.B.A12]|uniref:hypothetical protein n=1 Tax=Psychromonas sp. 14N.309.X.WAT.B.A12 TaxID=2998322 RepID=UPI0025AFE093|nr:hypothetical protein [Psychromonas sp. 14N.309.X.WAT.B.A12]MDN2663506.1 hypothetical protein [Psychromonas sp. 14N.309.X.WAT.B.A12]